MRGRSRTGRFARWPWPTRSTSWATGWRRSPLAVLVFDHTGDALATTALFISTKFLPSLLVPALAARVERIPRRPHARRALRRRGAGVRRRSRSARRRSRSSPSACWRSPTARFGRDRPRRDACGDRRAAASRRAVLREGNAALNVGFSSMNIAGPAAAGVVVADGRRRACRWRSRPACSSGSPRCCCATRGLPRGATDEAPWRSRLRAGAAYVWTHPRRAPADRGPGRDCSCCSRSSSRSRWSTPRRRSASATAASPRS